MTIDRKAYEQLEERFTERMGFTPSEVADKLQEIILSLSDSQKADAEEVHQAITASRPYTQMLSFVEDYAEEISQLAKAASEFEPPVADAAGVAKGPEMGANAFWWGFHIWFSHAALQHAYNVSDIVRFISGMVGAVAAASVVGLPLQVVAGFLGALLQLSKIIVQRLDVGNGVYFSWLWIQLSGFVILPPAPWVIPLPTSR